MALRRETPRNSFVRIGAAAEQLGVSVDTVRRWAAEGRIKVRRSRGGQRLVSVGELRKLRAERPPRPERPIVAQSARNRFAGTVTRVVSDRVAAVVEVQSGPHRLVSLMTAEAARELSLRPGLSVICVVKATNVIVDIARGAASTE